jgi:hypothetical protein
MAPTCACHQRLLQVGRRGGGGAAQAIGHLLAPRQLLVQGGGRRQRRPLRLQVLGKGSELHLK